MTVQSSVFFNISVEESQPLQTPNVTDVVFFTEEIPLLLSQFPEGYKYYINKDSVIKDFGINSKIAKAVTAFYDSPDNNLSVGGKIAIILLQNSTSATSGYFTTADISPNIANFQAVSNGSIKIKLDADGTEFELTNLNFSEITSLADIANVFNLNNDLINGYFEVSGNTLRLINKAKGVNATVTLSAGTQGTDLSATGLLDIANGIATAGIDYAGELIGDVLNRVKEKIAITNFTTTAFLSREQVNTWSAEIQNRQNTGEFYNFWYAAYSTQEASYYKTNIVDNNRTRTRLIGSFAGDQESLNLIAYTMAYMSSFNCVQAGSQTKSPLLQKFNNITTIKKINSTLNATLLASGIDTYTAYDYGLIDSYYNASVPSAIFNQVNLLQIVYAIKNDYLASRRDNKELVQYNNLNLNTIKVSIIEFILNIARDNLAIDRPASINEINGNIGFGNETIGKEQIVENGYYVYMMPTELVSSQDKINGKAYANIAYYKSRQLTTLSVPIKIF